MKQYTPIRHFYAWVGFIFLIILAIWGIVGVLTTETITYSSDEEVALEGEIKPSKTIRIWIESQAEVSAYTSDVAETDNTPFTSASGKRVFAGMIANNCLPFGTIVIIEDVEYIVLDRMNSRYGCEHFDIWMESKEDAIEWGRKNITAITPYQS